MTPIRIFISSVQKEFAAERAALRDYLRGDALMRRFFEVFLFERASSVPDPGEAAGAHGSVPGNPLLAEPMYLTGYIERMGTGTRDMIRRCTEAGLPEPEFAVTDGFQIFLRRTPAAVPTRPEPTAVAGEVTGEVARLLLVCQGELTRQALQDRLGLRGEENFRNLYLVPALDAGLIEVTRPGAPRSRLQKYRLTGKGRATLAALTARGQTS